MKSLAVTVSLFFFLAIGVIQAQEFQGKAYYESKTSVDVSGWGGNQMSEEQRKQMAERMKSMFEKTFVLTFNRTESMYKEQEKLATPGAGGGNRWGGMGSFTAGPQYKNVKDNVLLQDQEFFGKQFLIKDSLPKFEWKMENETKQIGQYLCFKATAVKKVDEMDFASMRPRNRGNNAATSNNIMDNVEVPKEIVVTAWYTPQIPVNQGPGDYWGLPGLILEVNADKTTILCSKIVINPDDKEVIKAPSKGKAVTKTEYNTVVKEKMQEMQDMYGGRNGGGPRGGNRF